MSFMSCYNSAKELYQNNLSSIKDVYFTLREIDVIACILHNRGEKKIASILSIAPRTVSAHVYNIMNKISCNSKDQIIDFVELSGSIKIFREYYLHLLVKSYFEEKLKYIANRVNRKFIDVYCYAQEIKYLDAELYKSTQEYLKLANINLFELKEDQNKQQISKQEQQNDQFNGTDNNFQEERINFEFEQIDLDNYYQTLFVQIIDIVGKKYENFDQQQILDDLINYCNSVNQMSTGNIISDTAEDYVDKEDQKKLSWVLNYKYLSYIIILLIVILVLVYTILSLQSKKGISEEVLEEEKLTTTINKPTIIKQLEEFLNNKDKIEISANNTNLVQIQKNHSLIKNVEKLLSYWNKKEVKQYFDNAEMSSEILTSYLYNLHALSVYYMYNMHDSKKSQELLEYSKDLAEQYIKVRSNINNDFSKYNPEEILSELRVVKDLAEIYTRVVYALGRSFIYDHEKSKLDKYLEQAKRYFKITKYMGNTLGLFEGYLSKLSGILMIDRVNITNYIQTGKYDLAKNMVIESLQKHKELMFDNKEYVLDFDPKLPEQNKIVPSESHYNKFECGMRIVWLYSMLILIESNTEEISKNRDGNKIDKSTYQAKDKLIAEYVQEINRYLVGGLIEEINTTNAISNSLKSDLNNKNKFEGLVNLLESLTDRKKNDLYNKLGELMLILYEYKKHGGLLNNSGSNNKSITSAITVLQNSIKDNILLSHDLPYEVLIAEDRQLMLAEKLFLIARYKSRSSDFTKKISYQNLIKTYQLFLQDNENTDYPLSPILKANIEKQIATLEKNLAN